VSSSRSGNRNHDEGNISIFRNSYEQIIKLIRSQLVAAKNIDNILAIAQFYGLFRWINADGIYQDDDLENLVEQRVIQNKKFRLPRLSEMNGGTVLIASELYDFGGHSRVVLNWLKAFEEEGDHRLLITRTVMDAFRSTLEDKSIPFHLCASQGIELVNEILAYCANAERVVLHIHPDDIVAVIAARVLAKSGKHIIFYNHADHVFSFGMSSAHMVCEVSTYGIEINKRARQLQDSCYLGIPIDFNSATEHRGYASEATPDKIIMSAGDSSKYAPGDLFFGDFIDSLCQKRSDVTFALVGPTGDEPWWNEVKERWGHRIHFQGRVPHAKFLDIMQKADVYVDSFPLTGGTAFPEALLNGKLVTGVSCPMQGYSCVDELRVRDVSALTNEVSKLLDRDKDSIRKIEEMKKRLETAQSITSFQRRIRSIYAGNRPVASSDIAVDIYWREGRWEKDKAIFLPDGPIWNCLPWTYSVRFGLLIIQLAGTSGREYRAYILRRILLRLLPNRLRNLLRRKGIFGRMMSPSDPTLGITFRLP